MLAINTFEPPSEVSVDPYDLGDSNGYISNLEE